MLPPISRPPSVEFGTVEALEIRRLARQGALRPILCPCDDGATYVVKPFSSGGAWPQIAEWVCARLGRAVDLPIPNYRQVLISPLLAEAWNATGGHFIEPGLGFGSQFVSGAVECDPALATRIESADITRLLAFDWWIRNSDRIRHNPNLLWSHTDNRHYLIDHEKAGCPDSSASFWQDHIFADRTPWISDTVLAEMRASLLLLPEIRSELPPEWTSRTEGLDWFVKQLTDAIATTPNKDWRAHE